MEKKSTQGDPPEQTSPSEPPEDKDSSVGGPADNSLAKADHRETPSTKSLWRDTIQPLLQSSIASVSAMLQYYVSHAGDLWHYFVEVTPFLEVTGDREREVRVTKESTLGADVFAHDPWRLTFPDCCVVTGDQAEGEWIEETRLLPDMAWPFWGTVAGVIGGFFISMTFWSFWPWLPSILIGMAVGYAKRQTREIVVRFRRSPEAANTSYPDIRVFPDVLLVRLGNSAAKKAFVRHRIERDGGSGSGRMAALGEPRTGRPADSSVGEPATSPKGREELPGIPLDD